MSEISQRRYVPILKGRMGEFGALARLRETERAGFTPLFELVPNLNQEDEPASAFKEIRTFADRLLTNWGYEDEAFIDTGYFPSDLTFEGGRLPITAAVDQLRVRGCAPVPVVRISDPDYVRHDLGRMIDGVTSLRVCVRVGIDDLSEAEAGITPTVNQLLEDLGTAPEYADVVLDAGVVSESLLSWGRLIFPAQLRELVSGRFRSVTFAAGGFPDQVTDVTPFAPRRIPRPDVALWRAVAGNLPRVGFGDYAIAHPAMPSGPAFAPAPQLRYTTVDEWIILRGRKVGRGGSQQFYELCSQLVRLPDYTGPDFSWGDSYIRAAADAHEGIGQVGTGNATTWRSIGTSHHIAFMLHRLATTDGA